MASKHDPVRVYVGHTWEADDDYLRVFEFLEGAHNFYYRNSSEPEKRPAGGKEAEREELRRQISPAEVVILMASHHRRAPDLIEFQANFAKASDKPVVLLQNFGSTSPVPKSLMALADEHIDWNARALIDAVRRQARHEDTHRWDTIDFTPD